MAAPTLRPREATGADWTIEVVVCPYAANRSITSSRCSTVRTWAVRM
jgi:hypothetical protein